MLTADYDEEISMETCAILIVEEEAIIAADIAGKLRRMDFQVSGTAQTAKQAVELAKRMCPQLAVVNLHLTGKLTGIKAANIIQELCDHLPILFLACYPGASCDIDKANLRGPYGCLSMPFVKADFEAEVGKLLQHQEPCDIIKGADGKHKST